MPLRRAAASNALETWPGFLVHGQVDPELAEDAVGLDEVTLHVDEQKRGVRGIDELGKLGEDALSLDLDHMPSLMLTSRMSSSSATVGC